MSVLIPVFCKISSKSLNFFFFIIHFLATATYTPEQLIKKYAN